MILRKYISAPSAVVIVNVSAYLVILIVAVVVVVVVAGATSAVKVEVGLLVVTLIIGITYHID